MSEKENPFDPNPAQFRRGAAYDFRPQYPQPTFKSNPF